MNAIEAGEVRRWMGQKVHVISVLSDGDASIVVFKRWYKFRWNYEAVEMWLFERYAEPA